MSKIRKNDWNNKNVIIMELVPKTKEQLEKEGEDAYLNELVPTFIGENVDKEMVKELIMTSGMETVEKALDNQKKKSKKNYHSVESYYKYIDGDLTEETKERVNLYKTGFDDDPASERVFISEDGQVTRLENGLEADSILFRKFGFTADMFPSELKTLEEAKYKLVLDTDDILKSGVDPEVFLVMDEEGAEEMDDDFFSKALELENREEELKKKVKTFNRDLPLLQDPIFDIDYSDYSGYGEEEDDEIMKSGMNMDLPYTKSYISNASHISNRGDRFSVIEEKAEVLLQKYNNGDTDEHDNGQHSIDWEDVKKDFLMFKASFENPDSLFQVDNSKSVSESGENNNEICVNELNNQEHPNIIANDDECNNNEAEDNEVNNQDYAESDTSEESDEEIYHTKGPQKDIRSVPQKPVEKDKRPAGLFAEPKKKNKKSQEETEQIIDNPLNIPQFQPKENETTEERKARKKAIKEFQRERKKQKKERKLKFLNAKSKVKKSIAASGAFRGVTSYNIE